MQEIPRSGEPQEQGEQLPDSGLPTGPVGSKGEQNFMHDLRGDLNDTRRSQPAGSETNSAEGDSLSGLHSADENKYDGTWLNQHHFTPEEAERLVIFSRQAANPPEGRESTETLKRLEFARWLIEHKRLDEFNVEEKSGNATDSTDVA